MRRAPDVTLFPNPSSSGEPIAMICGCGDIRTLRQKLDKPRSLVLVCLHCSVKRRLVSPLYSFDYLNSLFVQSDAVLVRAVVGFMHTAPR
jgi:hypothetical protein